jgi:hypothetical protein
MNLEYSTVDEANALNYLRDEILALYEAAGFGCRALQSADPHHYSRETGEDDREYAEEVLAKALDALDAKAKEKL